MSAAGGDGAAAPVRMALTSDAAEHAAGAQYARQYGGFAEWHGAVTRQSSRRRLHVEKKRCRQADRALTGLARGDNVLLEEGAS